MIERYMFSFYQTSINTDKVHLDSHEGTANRDDHNASWHVDGHDNLEKITKDTSTIPADFDEAIAQLKKQYKFYEGQDENILAVLNRYPFLLKDLNRIHEIKRQYFDEAPMSLCYLNETGWLEDADLSAAVEFDDDLWDKKFDSSFDKFQEKCWREMSQEAHRFISVGFE